MDFSWIPRDIRVLTAGAIAGACSRTVVSPLERLKIEFQVQDVLYKESGNTQHRTDRSIIRGLVQIYEREGFRGWLKGNGTNVLRIVPYASTQFLVFERAKSAILSRRGPGDSTSLNPFERLVAGGVGGMASVVVSYPLDFVRGRLTTQGEGTKTQYKGIWDAMKTITREEGPLALYRGVDVSLVGIFPYVGTNFMVYGTLKEHVAKWLDTSENKLPWYATLLIGGSAGACAQTVAYPFDLLRRRIQMEGFGAEAKAGEAAGAAAAAAAAAAADAAPTSAKPPAKLLSQMRMDRAFVHIAQTEGFASLYKGLIPNYLKVFPTMAVHFWVYERCKTALGLDK